jgi:serine/threonine protein kinase
MGDRIGQHLGNYRLLRLLGKGGAAEVYLGEHIHLNTHAAIKVLHTRLSGDEVEHFRTEARLLAHLGHPHIVHVLDFDVEDGTPFLVMEYAARGTVRTRYPKGSRLPLETIIAYVKQAADALSYLHEEKKMVHRDVKPENLLLRTDQDLVLSDFGIVVTAHTTGSLIVENLTGTLPYMAPEQFEGKPRPASDQYALGMIVYEWFSGKRPFDELAGSIMLHHVHTDPPALQKQLPTISSTIESVVHKALAKDPKERFATIGAFAAALEQASQQSPLFAVTSSTPLQPVSPLPPRPPAAVTTQLPRERTLPLPIVLSRPSTLPAQRERSAPSLKEPALLSVQSKGATPLLTAYPADKAPISTRRRGSSWGKVALLLGLVLVLGASAVWLSPMISHSKANSLALATATARARATATAAAPLLATAQAHATATAIVNAYNAATATGVMDGFDAEHTNFNPYEQVISPANVSELVAGWTDSTGGSVSAPTVANGVAYVESDKLYAFNATGCSHPFCAPLWTASIGLYIPSGASSGVGGGAGGTPPAVANGVVYVSSVGGVNGDNDRLYAFSATGCGHPSCSPLWTASMGYSPLTPSAPAVANGVVYVDSDKLYAFNATGCGHSSCSPLWTASISTWSSPAVANGVVYVDSDKLYAFRATGCGHPSCSPLWTTPPISTWSSPAVANGIAYTDSDKLYAFRATGCGHPSCSPLWTSIGLGGSSGDLGSSPAVAKGVVYVSTVDSRLYAFNATECGHPSCSPLWTSSTRSNDLGSWPMVVANGVIYGNVSLGGSPSPYLYAFSATRCGHPSCSPLWIIHLPVGIGTGGPIESPVIANGVVYFSESDQVFTFYLPSTAP